MLKMVLSGIIDDVPRWVQEKQAEESVKREDESAEERMRMYRRQAAAMSAESVIDANATATTDASCIATINTNNNSNEGGGSAMSTNGTDSSERFERNVVSSQISMRSQFGYSPFLLMGVTAFPLVMQSIGFSPLFYLPVALLFFSYLKADKDRQDRQSAIGIVSNYEVSSYKYK
jgi:hypothetical protein